MIVLDELDAEASNDTDVFTGGLSGDTVKDAVAAEPTTMMVDAEPVAPLESVATTVTENVPAAL